jgi:hypothetical protein
VIVSLETKHSDDVAFVHLMTRVRWTGKSGRCKPSTATPMHLDFVENEQEGIIGRKTVGGRRIKSDDSL